MEITGPSAITDILARGDVCHLALIDGGEPYIVALNYGYTWKEENLILYFHCAKTGKKLEAIKSNNSACVMVDIDHVLVAGEKDCKWGMNFSSVVGRGTIAFVSDPDERKMGLDLLMNHYTGRTEFFYDQKVFAMTELLRMDVTGLTGKKKG